MADAVNQDAAPRLAFPVVGIGASAGGLDAFLEFFQAVSHDSGMAYVLVQHLPPEHESMLTELLAKRTDLPIVAIEDGTHIAPNHVYVIRPERSVTLRNGMLHLGDALSPKTNNRPIDDFFLSLAEEQKERAICIVMSGAGSNGSEGARSVRAVGGLCIAQKPSSASVPSMPAELIEQGSADFVLRPSEMPETLLRYARTPYTRDASASQPRAHEEPQIEQILGLVRARTRRDFTGYKRLTITRRIHRRMAVHQIKSLDDYTAMLRGDDAEASALADDLLIHVTGFFRDPDAWESLRAQVIEPLVASREDNGVIRCWVTACATGEEAYTLAMLIDEAANAVGKHFDVKIFATDLAERALAHARAGIYASGIESDVAPERLERYFQKEDGVYRLRNPLRGMVVFAPQNVLQDPPFSRLDLCCCRNMLIYLEPPAQTRLLELLHFSLRDGGVLFLGTSETPGSETLFAPIDRRWRLYRKIRGTRSTGIDFSQLARVRDAQLDILPRTALARLTSQWLVDGHVPASVTVDRAGRVLYFHGDSELYLAQPRGEPTRELLSLVREGLRAATRKALEESVTKNEPTSEPSRLLSANDSELRAWVTVTPLERRSEDDAHFLVSFEQRRDPSETSDDDDDGPDTPQLNRELERVRQELLHTVTELQLRNEELRASNEEVTSINEELQSTNEELETSREELQSLNEELTTVNAQLEAKVLEHEATTNDLSSLLYSTDIAVVFLDTQFRIRRFTPAVRVLFDLIPSDAGRPLANLARKFVDDELQADAKAVLERLVPHEREIVSNAGRWYQRRILPYRTTDNRIDGVVITFIDITANKLAERRFARKARLLDLSNDAIISCDLDDRVVFWNQGAAVQFGYSREEALGRPLGELLSLPNLVPPADPNHDAYQSNAPMIELVATAKGGRKVTILCRWAIATDEAGRPFDKLLSSTDVTDRGLQREAFRRAEEQSRLLVDGARDFAMVLLDAEGTITAWNVGAERVLGYTEAEAVGQNIALIFTPEDRATGAHRRERAEATRDGRAEDARWHLRKDGQRFFSNGVMNALHEADGRLRGFVKILRDDTARKLAEESFKQAAEQAGAANRMKDAFLATLSHELRTPLAAIQLWTHVLKKQPQTDVDGRLRAIQAITQSVQAQNQLIDDLLDTVRIASGSLRVDVHACELPPLLHTWVESMRLTAEAKGVHLRLEADSSIGMVATDPDRLQQILWNLLKNAITFTPPGGHIGVSVRRDASKLRLQIADTGAGIAAEFLPHVFDAFRQADSSTSRSTGGLGLGLSIVSKLVHLLGGTIRAESPGLGQGATFTIHLPLSGRTRNRRRSSSGSMVGIRSTELAGKRILLVEDTPETREALTLILAGAGSIVTATADAKSAFAAFVAGTPDLIVSDIAMPGEDGMQLLQRIRAHETRAGREHVPALAVTALAHEDDRAQVLEAGFDAHLVKPFEAESLLQSVVDLLGIVASAARDS